MGFSNALPKPTKSASRHASHFLGGSVRQVVLLLLFLLLAQHPQTTTSHYTATCVGTDEPAATEFCVDDNIYVFVCTNHPSLTGSCFSDENQARVDVDTTVPFSFRPTINNQMAGSADLLDIPACSGPTASSSNNICKAPTGTQPLHCSCSNSNWFRYGPIDQQSTPASLTASIYGWGCQTHGILANDHFQTKACTNEYPAYAVLTPCSGSFPCTTGTAGAPSIAEGTASGITIARLDYRDCDTCSTVHGSRPSCTLSNGENTLTDLNVLATIEWTVGDDESDPIYELADDAGGRFSIEVNTSKLETGTTLLDYELSTNPSSSITGWTCTNTSGTTCFSGIGITNQVSSKSGASSWDPNTKEWTLYVYVTDVVGCKNTAGARKKSGPFPIKIKVDNVVEAPSGVTLVRSIDSPPMNVEGHLFELQPSSNNPTPWSLGANRKIGTLGYPNDGDCGQSGVTCLFECQTLTGWVTGNGNKCGGPSRTTFKIVNQDLLLATSSAEALNYEGGASGAVSDVTVRVTATSMVNGFPSSISSAGNVVLIPIANVNEAPSAIAFTSAGSIEEGTVADVVVGTLTAADPDVPLTLQNYTYTCFTECSPEFKIVGDEIQTTNVPTDFEGIGPAYSFFVQVVDQGNLPNGQVVVKEITIVVLDKIEAPTADDAMFAVDENSPSGTFVGNYGSPSYVTLGDDELAYGIVKGNSARKEYTYTNLVVDAAGAATMVRNQSSLFFCEMFV